MTLTLRHALAPALVLAGAALGLHLYEAAGVQATLTYRLPASAPSAPAALRLRVYPRGDQTALATFFARVSTGQEAPQQTLLLPPGDVEVRGALTTDTQALPLRATVQIHRAGTYEVYLEPAKE